MARPTNPFSLPELGAEILRPAAPRKAHQPAFSVDRARLLRVASRVPEVVIKVKHRGAKAAGLGAHFSYITRGGKLEAENERGEKIIGKAAVAALREDWAADAGSRRWGRGQVPTLNVIFSMPPGTNPERLQDAVKAFAREAYGNHQYLVALHTDEKHPHCHVCVKKFGFDGQMLAPDRSDLQLWREQYAALLRERGIAAEATPRRARGVVRKAERRPERGYRNRGEVSQARRARVEAAAEVLKGKAAPHPAEGRAHARQAVIRQSWQQLAERLSASADREDQALGRAVADFLGQMPPAKTESEVNREKLAAVLKTMQATKRPGIDGPSRSPATPGRDRGGPER